MGLTLNQWMSVIDTLAWPVAVIVVGIAALLILKGPLGTLLRRTESVGKQGIRFHRSKEDQRATDEPRKVEELMAVFNQQTVHAQEQNILRELETQKITRADARERILVRHLAGAQMIAAFRQISANIWQSQISILQHLSQRPGGTAELEELRPFYAVVPEPIRKRYPMDEYLGFLEYYALIKVSATSISITPTGRDFLAYLIREPHLGAKEA